jgi:hypothetical protein
MASEMAPTVPTPSDEAGTSRPTPVVSGGGTMAGSGKVELVQQFAN